VRRLALVVGIETYRDAGITPLRFAVHDATALAEALSDECRFDSVRTLAGVEGPDEPTAANILTALDGLTKDADDGDLFLFFFAGHGIERDEHTWLLTRDAYSGNPRVGSLPLADLREALPQHVGARILLIDACRNSPYAARGDLPNTLTDVVARDIKAAAKRSTTRHGTTAVLFACATGQRAYEWPDKKHGVFTHYLLEGLQNPPPAPPWTRTGLTIQRLAQHVTERVSRWSQRTPNLPHPQQPWYFQEGQPTDIQLATYVGAAEPTPSNTTIGTGRTGSAAPPLATPGRDPTPRATLVALKKAITANDLGAVQEALSTGVDVNARFADRTTPLHHAAKRARDPAIITALVHAGADVNAKDADGSTPLGIAANGNPNPDVHRALVHAGADIEGPKDFTPLMAAAAFNNADVVRTLIDLHADHEAHDNRGRTPLMWAARTNHSVAVTQTLIDTCASDGNFVLAINETSQEETTALGYALEGFEFAPDKRLDIIQALLGAGADPHIATHPATGKTAVQIALESGAGNPLYATIQPYVRYDQPSAEPAQPELRPATWTVSPELRPATWTVSNALMSFAIVMIAGLMSAALSYWLAPTQLPDSLLGSVLVYAIVIVGGGLLSSYVVLVFPAGIIGEVTKTPLVFDDEHHSAPAIAIWAIWLVPLGWVIVSIGAAFVPVPFDLALAAGMVLLAGVHGLTYVFLPPVPYAQKSVAPHQLLSAWTRAKALVSLTVVIGFGISWAAALWVLAPSGSDRHQVTDVGLVVGLCVLASLVSYYLLDRILMRVTGTVWIRNDKAARDHEGVRKQYAYVFALSPALLYGIRIAHVWQGAPDDSKAIWPVLGVFITTVFGVLAFVHYPPIPYSKGLPTRAPVSGTKRTAKQSTKRNVAPAALSRAGIARPRHGTMFIVSILLIGSLVAFGLQWPQSARQVLDYGHGLFEQTSGWIRALPSSVPPPFAPSTSGTQVGLDTSPLAVGEASSLIVDPAGRVWATGSNWAGNLGDGTTTARSVFTQTLFPSDVRIEHLAADGGRVLALDQHGHAWAWGENESGELGDGTRINRSLPVRVQMPSETAFVAVTAGYKFSLALDGDGIAWSWGTNWAGQLGDGTKSDRYRPTRVSMPVGTRFSSIAAGSDHVLALDTDGKAWEWGRGIADDGASERLTPVRVPMPAGLRFTAIAAGNSVSFGIDSNGRAWSWGSPGWMMLGTGAWGPQTTPARVDMPSGIRFVAIAPGTQSVMALDQHGSAWEWGGPISEMASGTRFELSGSPAPIAMPSDARFTHVRLARGWFPHHALAIDHDGQVWAWGSNEMGQLGTDDPGYQNQSPSPILITSNLHARDEQAEPQPANDDFSQATHIYRMEGVLAGSNLGATNEPAEPDHAREHGQSSVWFAWRSPSQPVVVTFSTIGSAFDTLLHAYASETSNQPQLRDLTLVAGNDDADGTQQSRITFEATPNTTYYVAVSGYQGAAGDFTLTWSDATHVWDESDFTLTWSDATHVWDESDFGNAIATGLELWCDSRRAYASSFDGGPYPMERCPPSERLAFSRTDDPVGWDLSAPWFTFFGSHQLSGVRAYFVSWTISELRGTGGFNNLNVYLQPDGGTPYLAFTIESQTPDSEVYDPRYPDRILASVRDYAPGDANCCPSASTQQVYRATDARLELVERRTVSHVQPRPGPYALDSHPPLLRCAQAAALVVRTPELRT
jgi:alpha-tubulin suppressor-like RCC1 family protein